MRRGTAALVLRTIFEGLLYKRSPHLDELKIEDLRQMIARKPPRTGSYCVVALSRVLASMGTVPETMEIKRPVKDKKLSPALTNRGARGVVPAQPSLVRPSNVLA